MRITGRAALMGACVAALLALACDDQAAPPTPATPGGEPTKARFDAQRLTQQATKMGTQVTLVAYTNPQLAEAELRSAFDAALGEISRLEALLSSWREDSEVAKINANAGSFVRVSPETFEVVQRSQWISRLSDGAFDITFEVMSELWKFGGAAEETPMLPDPKAVAARRELIDYRRLELEPKERKLKLPKGMKLALGGIAKGYIVDRAAAVLKERGVTAFLVQAGGDLYGHGRKPDGSAWSAGIQDPRGARGSFFASVELENHAFSTAGDYARAFVVDGKRYHHIIDPTTGYPATASRSVTAWAPDAFTADAIDDAVFILGPKRGLELVEQLPGAGAVIVDADNTVHVSERLKHKLSVAHPPSDGI